MTSIGSRPQIRSYNRFGVQSGSPVGARTPIAFRATLKRANGKP